VRHPRAHVATRFVGAASKASGTARATRVSRPNPAIAGSTVHRGVEVIVRALRDRGCGSVRDADAVAVLRDLGGFTEIVSTALDSELEKHEDNPRMARRLPLMRSRLQQQLPAMREALQVLTSRITLVRAPNAASHRGAAGIGEGGARALI
jgi:hypothetical protein